MKKKYLLNPLALSIQIIVLVFAAYWSGVPFLDLLELRTVDLRFRSRGEIVPSDKVVLAVIDEKSIDQEGKWIWPRSKMADMVNKLSDAGVRVIGFDIGFLEPDDQRLLQTIDGIKRKVRDGGAADGEFETYLDRLMEQSDYDRLLAEAIATSNARVVVGYFFHMGTADTAHVTDQKITEDTENIQGSAYKLVRFASEYAEQTRFIEASAPESNIPEISRATEYAGFFNMFPDSDGVVRRIPAVIKFEDTLYSPLSLNALSAYLEKPLSVRVNDHGVESVKIGSLAVPTDEMGRIFIHYHGGPKTFPHISIADILKERTDPALLKDKIVLVGATAVGIFDLRVTPFGSVFPGLEVHANVVEGILSQKFMYQPAWAAGFDILAIVVAGLVIGMALARAGAVTGAVAAVIMFLGYIFLCQYLFEARGWILNLVYPLSTIILAYVSITAFKYLSEARQKKFIRNAFSTYLAPAVVKQLIDSPGNLNLGGEERVITAFFSDVQGFTSISENLTPAELVDLLNEFLTEMTDIILAHEGTVDKFEGDAIIAFFGAPNPIPNHAERACMTCIDMQVRLEELRERWRSKQKPELKMRIGMCSGPAVVGNMGSKSRMDYTMMGDTVNTAARLEGVNKVYGTYTMVSATTYQDARDRVLGRELDAVNVVGKDEPITIYELMGYRDQVDQQAVKIVELYAKGLSAYRNREWVSAMKYFKQVLSIVPEDGPSRTMFLRCRRYREKSPAENWNGAFTMDKK